MLGHAGLHLGGFAATCTVSEFGIPPGNLWEAGPLAAGCGAARVQCRGGPERRRNCGPPAPGSWCSCQRAARLLEGRAALSAGEHVHPGSHRHAGLWQGSTVRLGAGVTEGKRGPQGLPRGPPG